MKDKEKELTDEEILKIFHSLGDVGKKAVLGELLRQYEWTMIGKIDALTKNDRVGGS